MYSIRKWMFKPKKTDTSLLAQFFYSDEELNMVATELDSFDGRKDPERCSALVNQLRMCQDKVLTILEKIMDEANPMNRSNRDFRVKFPDDVLQESLAGQLWFGAECLAAGSSIMNREVESASMRPLAKALTRHLDYVRSTLRDQCLKNSNTYTEKIKEALRIFDRLFAEFELSYVSAMVPVKTMKEYDTLQEVIVLFSETTQRALRLALLTQDMIDDYDPALMFTIPRLAIVCGLLIHPDGPLNPDMDPMNMSEMFRPFQTLLYKIRELLWTLSADELWMLEKLLCSSEEPGQYHKPVLTEKKTSKNGDQLDPLTAGHMYTTLGNGYSDLPVHLRAEANYDVCSMSQSPSIVTIVANPNYDGAVKDDDDEVEAGIERDVPQQHPQQPEGDLLDMDSLNPGISHQDSADSGNHSDENSLGYAGLPSQAQADSRLLRHSLSWPESRHRMNNSTRLSDSAQYLEDDDDGATPRPTCTHRSSTHEFNFHLPLNTETVTSYAFEQSDVSARSADNPDNKADCRPSPLQRIFITSDSCDASDCEDSSQISFVTETLNEVFVTDTAFRGGRCIKKTSDKVANENIANELESSNESAVSSDALKVSDSNGDSPTNASVAVATNSTVIQDSSEQDSKEVDRVKRFKQSCVKCQNKQRTVQEAISSPVGKKVCHCQEQQTMGANSCDNGTVCTKCQVPSSSSTSYSQVDSTANVQSEAGQPSSTEVREQGYVCTSATCSTCNSPSHSVASVDGDWDRQSYASTDTSSYNSDCQDDEEIALAIQAAEMAARHEARSRFKSSTDLIHRLFVCISGVADQLQTNYASDLRHILKCVFQVNASETFISMEENTPSVENEPQTMETASEEAIPEDVDEDVAEANENMVVDRTEVEEEEEDSTITENLIAAGLYPSPGTSPPEAGVSAPSWVPDDLVQQCTSCMVPFTFVRRRHHCRNCGKIFCGRCSSNTVPLPHYGHTKPVRVCNHCFIFQVNPFTMST